MIHKTIPVGPRTYRVHIAELRIFWYVTSKPETIIKQMEELSPIYSKSILKFKDWLVDEEDSSFANAGNYLRVLNLFSVFVK